MDWHARWRAYKLEEQAVSRVKLAPARLKNHDSLFESIALLVPDAAFRGRWKMSPWVMRS